MKQMSDSGISSEKLKVSFKSNGLKVNFEKINVMVSGSIASSDLSTGKVDSCGVCCLGVKVNSV